MTSFTLDPYREIASTLSPSAVSQYLATGDWELESRRDHMCEVWRLPAPAGQRPRGRIMLPLATDYDDFPQRFYDALHALGRVNGWDATELLQHIIATRADLFYVRLDQPMPDGTIPFRQAEETIEAIYRLLRSAATTAADPDHSHRGRRPSKVTDFLDEDVRLGHTKRGSFVFTVVARLGDPSSTVPTAAVDQRENDAARPFARQVMETLAKGLNATASLTRGEGDDALQEPGRWGLSADLVESLEQMAEPEGLRALDLSFEWAAAEPQPDVVSSRIILDHSAAPMLARVKERLTRQEEPPSQQTLIGAVRALSREDSVADEEDEGGTIVLHAEVNGRMRKVQVPLAGPDYDWAIIAHRAKQPLTVSGELTFERRSWRLGNPEVDSRFLRQQFGEGDRPGPP
ncbi:hypothetical protein [Actinomadura hibisca]|uniref:hypothetical protein n=1 Tax=Actinomadura hibisca TaxID=68565 RepID=UPI00083346A3|nr:hypothetical protein [Actinomadura hibisca]